MDLPTRQLAVWVESLWKRWHLKYILRKRQFIDYSLLYNCSPFSLCTLFVFAASLQSLKEEQCREASSLTPQPGSQLWNTSCPGLNSALCLGMCWPDRISGGGWHSEERAAKCLSTMRNSFCCILHWKSKWKALSHVRLFATPWTKQPMEFSRPEYWSGYPFPSPGDLPNPGVEPRSPTLQADSLLSEPLWKPPLTSQIHMNHTHGLKSICCHHSAIYRDKSHTVCPEIKGPHHMITNR